MSESHFRDLNQSCGLPTAHEDYLKRLKEEGFEPRVVYDIGCCVLAWTKAVERIWPDAKIILFDANPNTEFLYKDYDYYCGVLSEKDDTVVRYYMNNQYPTGNSYYKELNDTVFPRDSFVEAHTRSLASIVSEKGFPLPDLIKIDVQGAETDIINGGLPVIKNTKRLIVEMQHSQYNEGAPLVGETRPFIESLGFECTDPAFCDNGPDADYGFVNSATN